MSTISAPQMRSILEYLDTALAACPPGPFRTETKTAWNIRMARYDLLHAAIADVEVEPKALLAADAAIAKAMGETV